MTASVVRPGDVRAELVRIERELGRRSLSWFVRHAWPQVEQTPYAHGWHIDLVCEHLEAVTRGEIRKLVINVPPGSGKSLLVCVFWPVWAWLQDPSLAFLFSSFDIDLTTRDAERAKTLATSDWFLERWGSRVVLDPNDPVRFYGTRDPRAPSRPLGGWRYATSVDGKATGRHPDVRVIDDPTKPREATAENLKKAIEWWQNTMRSRQRNAATVRTVLIMQRLAEEDLAGYFLTKEEGWTHLRIPLEYDAKRPCVTPWGADPRTEEGETFNAGRFPADVVREIKRDTPDIGVYSSQWQQDPTPAQGQTFQASWLGNRWEALPTRGVWLQSWDCSFTGEGASDFVVGQVWLHEGARFYLVDQIRKRMDFAETAQAVIDFSAKWPKAIRKVIEAKANGHAILSYLQSKVSGLEGVTPVGGKLARARSVTPLFSAGNVWLPASAPWVRDYVDELQKFPRGRNDDQVDATSQALAFLAEGNTGALSLAMRNWRKSPIGGGA